MGFCSYETSTVVVNQEGSPDPQSSMVMAMNRQRVIQRFSRLADASSALRKTADSRQTSLMEEILHKNGGPANGKVVGRVITTIPKKRREEHKRQPMVQDNRRNTLPTMMDMAGVSELAIELSGHCKVVQQAGTVEGRDEGPSQNHARRARSGRTLGDLLSFTLPHRSSSWMLTGPPSLADDNTHQSSAMATVQQRTGAEAGTSSKPAASLPQSRTAEAPKSSPLLPSSRCLDSSSHMPIDGIICMNTSPPSASTQEKGGAIVSSSSSLWASSSPSLQDSLHQRLAPTHSVTETGQAAAPMCLLTPSMFTSEASLESGASSSPAPSQPAGLSSFQPLPSTWMHSSLKSTSSSSSASASFQPLSSSTTMHSKEDSKGPSGCFVFDLQSSPDRNTAPRPMAQAEHEAKTASQTSDATSAGGDPSLLSVRLPLSSFLAEREDQGLERIVWETWEEPTEQLDPLCCVCMVGLKGAAFIPCGHTFCRKCSREIWRGRSSCPLCNRCISEILDIF